MLEPPVRIENRSQLAYLLAEAAELEHGILSCYLFAAFSLKDSTHKGLTPDQLEAVQAWKNVLVDISIQEMLHFGLVNNLLAAIGAAPHVQRPNLPTSPAMYPQSFQLALRPFDEKTLASFVFLERPEGLSLASGKGRMHGRAMAGRDIFSNRPEYETIGHLYRGIEDGFRYLEEKLGPERLFAGPARAQAPYFPGLKELGPVSDLSSASAAIRHIVEQGEGASAINREGHYARFSQIQQDLQAMRAQDPAFEPGRPVVDNPFTRMPGDLPPGTRVSIIEDTGTIAVSNLFDGAYEVFIQALERYFSPAQATEAEMEVLIESIRRLMVEVMNPLGNLLTTLPAGPSYPGMTAGPSFSVVRGMHAPPQLSAVWSLWGERLRELSGYCAMLETMGTAPAALTRVGESFQDIAANLQRR